MPGASLRECRFSRMLTADFLEATEVQRLSFLKAPFCPAVTGTQPVNRSNVWPLWELRPGFG